MARSRARPASLAKFRTRITGGKLIALGPGRIARLDVTERSASIAAVAKGPERFCRRAWPLQGGANCSQRRLLADTAPGGAGADASELTDADRERECVDPYRRLERKALAACRADICRLMGRLAA